MSRIEGKLHLERSWFCAPDLLGAEIPVRIGGAPGVFAFPVLPAGFADGPFHKFDTLSPPPKADSAIANHAQDRFAAGNHHRHPWGRPYSWPTGISIVTSVYMWFPCMGTYEGAVSVGDTVHQGLLGWLGLVEEGVEVLSGQLLGIADDIREEYAPVQFRAYLNGDRAHLAQSNSSRLRISAPNTETAVTAQIAARVFENASSGVRPLLSYSLLRQARRALHEADFRRSIVDAATAAEVAVTRATEREAQRLLGAGGAKRLCKKYGTLGNKLELCEVLGLHLPADDLNPVLVSRRNKAVHEGDPVNGAAAREALTAAQSIVSAFEPEPYPNLAPA